MNIKITPWIREFTTLDTLADQLFNGLVRGQRRNSMIYRTVDNGIDIEMPGIGKENIEVVDNNDSIRVTWKDKRISENHTDYIDIQIPVHSDTKVEYVNGVLQIRYSKSTDGKKITIN